MKLHKSDMFGWAVLSDEQMSNGYPFSLLNDEQMSNKVGVKHLPVGIVTNLDGYVQLGNFADHHFQHQTALCFFFSQPALP